MFNIKRLLFIFLAICVISIPISFFTFAQESVTFKKSDGTEVTITDATKALAEYNKSENDLGGYRIDLATLVNERNGIQYAIDRNTSSLNDLAAGLGIGAILGKRPDVAAVMLFARELLRDLENNIKNYKLRLKLIDKYVEIYSKNNEIANAYSDRDKYHAALAKFEGYKRNKSNEGSLSSMQESIPPLGAACAGGGCGEWYYDEGYYEFYHAQTIGGKYGTPVSLSNITTYAISHLTTCSGCNEKYWSCKDADKKAHQVSYCEISISYYNNATADYNIIDVCGTPHRACDKPRKKENHTYFPVTGYGQSSSGQWGYYTTGYNPTRATKCKGSSSKPTASIYGPGGTGLLKSHFDKTPNCDTCMDGSEYCPNASHQHGDDNGATTGSTPTYDSTPTDNTPDCSSCTDGCSSCQTSTPDSDDSGGSTMVTCEDCGVEYDSSNDMYTHVTFTCIHCGEPFKPCHDDQYCPSNWADGTEGGNHEL